MIIRIFFLFVFIVYLQSCNNNAVDGNTSADFMLTDITEEYLESLKVINDNDSLVQLSNYYDKELKGKLSDSVKSYYYSQLGVLYYQHSLFELADSAFGIASISYVIIGDSTSFSNMRMNQAAMKEIGGNYEEAISLYLEVIEFFQRKNDSIQLASAYSNLGVAYEEMEVSKKSIEYHKKALKLRLLIKDTLNTAYSYNNLGVVFTELYGNSDSALYYYEKASHIFRITNSLWQFATVSNNIGHIYLDKDEYIKAEQNFEYSLSIYDSLNINQGKGEVLRSYGQLYFAQGKDTKAIGALKRSLEINAELGNQKELLEINRILSKIYISKGNFSLAIKTIQIYNNLNDSLLNIEKQKTIADMETKYQLKEKNKTIEVLRLEEELSRKQIRYQLVFISLLVVVFVLIVFLFYFNTLKNKLKQNHLRTELQNYLLRINEMQVEIEDKKDCPKFSESKLKEYELSQREAQVLELISRGYKNSEIADKLFVSQNTVKSHIKNIYVKLDVKNRVEALKRVDVV
ncbi:MAG: LuxR family transcriptional regulator [Bacteroidota bacterium]